MCSESPAGVVSVAENVDVAEVVEESSPVSFPVLCSGDSSGRIAKLMESESIQLAFGDANSGAC
jgi:hypothetical protein